VIGDGRVLALVPARAGSKGLPGKNVHDLCGKPLVAWTIEAGRASRLVDDLVVSTDSEDIASISRRYGAEVPFIRPSALATDEADSVSVVEHALTAMRQAGRTYEFVVLLEPTSPLREAADIDAALTRLHDAGAGAIVSVCRLEHTHPAFVYRTTAAGRLTPFLGGAPVAPRRQDVEPLFFLDGSLYASRVETLLARRSFYHDDTLAYEVPYWKSPEIDDEVDLLWVEAIMRSKGLAR
jgi:N-acylneuraminate cytidylyltransferase/CMP-N,N'-diacetyllegionaminic acid synthase